MKPLVSLVVPFYHGTKYVDSILAMAECNARVLQNAMAAGMELVIVNDSPDTPLTITDQSPYTVRVLTNPENRGIHYSRVRGLREAEGDFIQFLDQDDRITENCLLSQLQHIGKADFVIANGTELLPDGSRRLIYESRIKQVCAADLKCHYYYNNLIRSPGQVLIRKESVPQYWLDHIMSNNGSDDAFLWILMLLEGKKVVINEEAVYEHVFTGENTSGSDEGMLRSQREVAEKLKGIASSFGIRAFRRRAEYYCLHGPAHRMKYMDVGILRTMYAKRYMSKSGKGKA